jgi:hypothetical protein
MLAFVGIRLTGLDLLAMVDRSDPRLLSGLDRRCRTRRPSQQRHEDEHHEHQTGMLMAPGSPCPRTPSKRNR